MTQEKTDPFLIDNKAVNDYWIKEGSYIQGRGNEYCEVLKITSRTYVIKINGAKNQSTIGKVTRRKGLAYPRLQATKIELLEIEQIKVDYYVEYFYTFLKVIKIEKKRDGIFFHFDFNSESTLIYRTQAQEIFRVLSR